MESSTTKRKARRNDTAGVVLCVFGKAQYIHMASHLAMSIKHFNKDIKIHLIHDESKKYLHTGYYQFIDGFTPIKREDLYPNGVLDPGHLKCSLYDYLPYNKNLYLDVDALCLHDISYLLELDGDFQTIEIGKGNRTATIPYSIWATNKNIWEYFDLKEDQECAAVQSSAQFIKKGKKAEKFYKLMKQKFFYPHDKLLHKWGSSVPDELIIAGCAAKLDMDIAMPKNPVFFGNKMSKMSLTEIQNHYGILSLYGNGGGNALVRLEYREWYDRLVTKYTRKMNVPQVGRSFQLLRGKYVNR